MKTSTGLAVRRPKKAPPLHSSRRNTIHKSTGRECVSVSGQRGLFAAGLDYLSLLHRCSPLWHVTVNATVHTFTLSRAWQKRRHSYATLYVCMYVPILSGEEKKKRREESRPNPLHSRGAVAEAGIWLIYGLLSVCNNRRLYPPLIHPAINNRPLRSLHAARTRDHLRPGGWKGNELIRELPRGETLTRSPLFGGMTVFDC